ncbi:MAG: DUF5906 domain-containing protein [Fusobacteriaceae bacterium]
MAKYNYKKILDTGKDNIVNALLTIGLEKVRQVKEGVRFEFNDEGYDLILGKTKGVVESENGVSKELEFFLKEINKIDAFINCLSETLEEKEDLRNIVLERYKAILEDVKLVGEMIYIYHNNYYQFKSFSDLERDIFAMVHDETEIMLDDSTLEKIAKTVYRLFSIKATKYDIREDKRYMKVVPLAFNNGTLYIKKDSITFKENTWLKDDNLFFKFNIDYGQKSNGIISEWFSKRFETTDKFDDSLVAISLIADLFITNNFSQVMGYFWGTGGTGKSLLQETLSKVLTQGAVSNVNIKDIGSDFKIVPLFSSVINFSSEINRKNISSDSFKSVVARDKEQLNQKFKNVLVGRPLAKWNGTGNSLPTIEMDSGVSRRLLTLQIKDEKIVEFEGKIISKSDFERHFFEDEQGIVDIIIKGIRHLFNFKFDLNLIYDEFANIEHSKDLKILNDSIEFFLEECIEPCNKETGIYKDNLFEAFEFFRSTIKGTSISAMKSQTFKARVTETGVKEVRKSFRCGFTGKVKNTPRFYEAVRFRDDFLVQLEKASINYLAFEMKDYTEPKLIK